MTRRMDQTSSGSHSSALAPAALVPIKPEPQETPLRRRSRGGNLVINEAGRIPSRPFAR